MKKALNACRLKVNYCLVSGGNSSQDSCHNAVEYGNERVYGSECKTSQKRRFMYYCVA